jgi:hypothetical protein
MNLSSMRVSGHFSICSEACLTVNSTILTMYNSLLGQVAALSNDGFFYVHFLFPADVLWPLTLSAKFPLPTAQSLVDSIMALFDIEPSPQGMRVICGRNDRMDTKTSKNFQLIKTSTGNRDTKLASPHAVTKILKNALP